VTRGQLPQRAGLPGLNGGGAAAAVPPREGDKVIELESTEKKKDLEIFITKVSPHEQSVQSAKKRNQLKC